MPPELKILQHVIASSFFYAYPHIPDVLHHLHFEGLLGFEVPHRSNPWANLVCSARLSQGNADTAIQQIYDYFARENRRFGWMLDSDSTPDDLTTRLEKIGMSKSGTYAGMALFDMDSPIQHTPEIEIRRATLDDIVDIVVLMNEAFGSGDSNRALYEYSLRQADHFFFLAYVKDSEQAVALGRMYYFPNTEIVVMQDAVTTSAYRGRGIYGSLMAKRLEVAQQDGKVAAVMQADRKSSAPICARMGFKEISNLDFYTT